MVDMDKYELLEQLQLGGSVEGASNPQENLKQEHNKSTNSSQENPREQNKISEAI